EIGSRGRTEPRGAGSLALRAGLRLVGNCRGPSSLHVLCRMAALSFTALCGPAVHSFAEVAEIASRVLGTQITYQQTSVDTFAESIGQTGNALFKVHCRAVAVELQEGIFAET